MQNHTFGQAQENKAPLLFIHGAYCASWIWEKHFLPFFAHEGFYGAAMSLRGHGLDADRTALDFVSVQDFLDDIHAAVKSFDTPPVLIGHSMGGYLVQRYALDHHDVRAMAILSAPALTGLAASSRHIFMNNPQLGFQLAVLMAFGPCYADAEIVGNGLCSAPLSADEVEELRPYFQSESKRAMAEMMVPCVADPAHKPPTLVMGGDIDAFVPVDDFHRSADVWDAQFRLLPGVPHGLMMDRTWPLAAKELKLWLDKIRT